MAEKAEKKEHKDQLSTAAMEETIKKEMKFYKLYEHFTITPSIKKNIVLSEKPNTTSVQKRDDVEDEAYKKMVQKMSLTPRERFLFPMTTSQEYGWDVTPLLPVNAADPRFHHPRVSCEITKKYGNKK